MESWLWGFDQFIEDITTPRGNSMKNYEVKLDEFATEDDVNPWFVYDNDKETIVNNEWFETEKQASDYLQFLLVEEV